MSLTERTTSHAFEDLTPPGEEADPPAGSPTTRTYPRSLSGAPADPSAGPSEGPEWADDRRLDELFSAWAEAALAADVVTDRGRTRPVDEPAWTPPAPGGADVAVDDPATAYGPSAYGDYEAPAYGDYEAPAYPAGDDIGPAPLEPEAPAVWSRDDDEIIPQRRGRRWGLRRR